jgi:transposase
MAPLLDERQRRLMSGSMARALGRGGQAAVVRTSKMSSRTVFDGTKEAASNAGPSDRVRRKGGGRPRLIDVDPDVLLNLDDLVEPESRGDPMSALRWTLKSTRQLADSLRAMGHQISSWTVGQLLHEMGYSLQATSKTVEGAQHPDRDAQFHHINDEAKRRLAANEPVISVDTKKKELVVGTKANNGREWQPAGSPERVDVHDFPESEVPKAVPYGVYDIGANEGWMEVGSDHDTAQFAVSAIKRWWQTMGIERYPRATRLMVTADAGGSNGYRNKLWKVELAKLASETGLAITVCHYPPGSTKRNKVEHRLFSFISINWRGRPLTSYRTIVELAAATTTRTGLKVQAEWDDGVYQKGIKITDKALAALPITRSEWHGEWNYTVAPTDEERRR